MQTNILHVISNPQGRRSLSSEHSEKVVNWIRSNHENSIVIRRDLQETFLPRTENSLLIDQMMFELNDFSEWRSETTLSTILINEVLRADFIVISSSIINNKVCYKLKDWMFQLFHKGLTFKETEHGIEGLLIKQKVFLVDSSYGIYTEKFLESISFQESYLKAFLGFLGIKDIQIVKAAQVVNLVEY